MPDARLCAGQRLGDVDYRAAEELFPVQEDSGGQYRHEHYSAAIVRTHLRSAIEDHPLNNNHAFKADDVAALLEGSAGAKQGIFWRDLIDGQMDADKMDFLLRDSYHCGVQYGRFDLGRLNATVQAIPGVGGRPPRLGISEGGWHAAEALVLARYFMFTQVYFHKTRVAYDIHLRGALKEMLPGGHFPKPVGKELDDFLLWDDWRVLGLLADGHGGDHGRRLSSRDHFRRVYATPEICSDEEMERLNLVKSPVVSEAKEHAVLPLSQHSSIIASIKSNNQVLLYAKSEEASAARAAVNEALKP